MSQTQNRSIPLLSNPLILGLVVGVLLVVAFTYLLAGGSFHVEVQSGQSSAVDSIGVGGSIANSAMIEIRLQDDSNVAHVYLIDSEGELIDDEEVHPVERLVELGFASSGEDYELILYDRSGNEMEEIEIRIVHRYFWEASTE